MIEWKVVRKEPSGLRAPCKLCDVIIPASRPRWKLWNNTMRPTGGKNGPGIWTHPACAEDLLGAVAVLAQQELDLWDL